MENLQKVENSLQNIELENTVNIDWLSLNFKNIQAEELLEIFCNATNDTNVSFENFVYNDNRGYVTGYTHSYSYLGTPYIVISFCPGRSEMGVNIQITGQGCKLIYFDDLIRFLEETSKITDDYKCNRLDIAFDDFNRIIPVREMIESTRKELDENNGITTINSRIKRDMMCIYTNHWNGYTSENLVFGKHRSARSFRLYDKKLEQKRLDIDYWYRLEIELRTKGKSKNADIAFKQFINKEKTIYDIFYDNISTIVTFTKEYKCNTASVVFMPKISYFWIDFLDYLTSHNTYFSHEQVKNTKSDKVIRKNKPTLEREFFKTFQSFVNQYSPFLELLHSINDKLIDKIRLLSLTRFDTNKKYKIYLNYFKKQKLLGKEFCFV